MWDFKKTEEEVLRFWKQKKIFEKSLKKTRSGKTYVFYDGPPFATGLPHYGHILASVLKDAIPRFWTMNGYYVRRVWGWDCHGLPIESIAERELKIKTKNEIEKMGIKKFNEFCRSRVLTYVAEWKKTIERIARWTEFDTAYKTMDNEYIESVWWAFKQLFEKGLIYEGEKVLMYCPRCETPLSKSEIAMDDSYRTIREDTITVKFKLLDEEVYALAWTTTPWTLPSNLALAVNPDMDYAYVRDKADRSVYLLGKESVSKYFKSKDDYAIIKEVRGKKLIGKKYEPLFPYFKNKKNAFKIIAGDFVTAEEGTGMVHTAPDFGEIDYDVCRENNIGVVKSVDESGRFTDDIKDFKGMKVRDADPKIIEFLKKQGRVVKVEKTEHEYPFCYRCETPLIYRAIPAWFVNIQKIKPKLLKLNEKINWYPGFLKHGRFRHNLETAPDWNISRNRYWATAIPMWRCDFCNEIRVLGSTKELKDAAINLPKKEIDLHKHILDKIKLKCKCKKEMTRIPEVLDCWFESGSMPFAQFHYPFENKKSFKENFPSDFVAEYTGQLRTWFYYMLAMSTILFNKIPFKNVLVTGTILAEDGSKMSKSKKNFPDPWEVFEKYGVDSLRFYLLSSPVMGADDLNFAEKGVEEVYKKVLLLIYNINRFYKIQGRKPVIKKHYSDHILDKWIIARLEETTKKITDNLKAYNTIKTCSEIRDFTEDLSTWYVRRSRERFNMREKKAHQTLGFVLNEFSKIIAPVMPLVSEAIYQALNGKSESVHLQKWPKAKKEWDKEIIKKMEEAREVVSLALRERDGAGIPLRQPLSKLVIGGKKLDKEYLKLILEEVNVKKIEIKTGKEVKVELDTKITTELKAEGYARELSRQVQEFRKKLGLEKGDRIKLFIITDDEFKQILVKQKKFIMDRTNSKKLEIVTTHKERFKNKIGFTIKDKRGKIAIIVTNR